MDLRLSRVAVAAVFAAFLLPSESFGASLTKSVVSGSEPVGLSKSTSSPYLFSISLGAPFDPAGTVIDRLPAELDVVELTPSCGAASAVAAEHPKEKSRKLEPDTVTWDLDGGTPCSGASDATLTVTAETVRNAGRRRQRPRDVFEPTTCGPLTLNEGASLVAVDGSKLAFSNSLAVATCLAEGDAAGCIDADGDGWSVSCGDCDDDDPATHPGAEEICDGRDNDCNGQVDDGAAEGQTGCDDGNACTRVDVCRSGQCVGEDPVTCPEPDACHLAGSCNPATGACSNPRQPDGTSCSIANACSLGADVCEFGVCVPAGEELCETPLGADFAFAAVAPAAPSSKAAGRSAPRRPGGRPLPTTFEERLRLAVHAQRKTARAAAESLRGSGTSAQLTPDEEAIFEQFVGFWMLDSIDDWSQATAMEFYRTDGGDPRVRFYDGTQNDLREVNDNDWQYVLNPVAPLGNDVAVSVTGPKALRIHNTAWPTLELSSDDLASSARIQDDDGDVLYAQFWTEWDGTADDPRYGSVENLSRYRRLAEPPLIQRNDQPSAVDWSDPLEIFRYVHDYYALLAQVEKVEALHQVEWVGAAGYEALYQQFLNTGVTRQATTSTALRGGGYIGVWRTQFPGSYPFTTIHTTAPHRFTPGTAVTISGFAGEYAVLNGVHQVPAYPASTWTGSTPEPWQAESSREPYVLVDVDTSGIAVPYDPNFHGVGHLEATHGPINSATEYRELAASLADFVVSAFGSGTHTRLRIWARWDNLVPETFDELRGLLATGSLPFFPTTVRTRDSAANGAATLYWNPWWVGGTEFDLNDPFGLRFVAWDPTFDYDIDLQNYLDPVSARNVFFTITGPVMPTEPITGLLTDWGYPSNGSQVVFRAGAFATPPADLVDGYGSHPFVPYGAASGNYYDSQFRYHWNLLGGMVREELSCGQKVAYIRIGDEDAFDAPLYQLSMRSLAFGRPDMQSRVASNWTAAMAALLAELEPQRPDRYILDIRQNNGGFTYVGDAFAALFGGDRPGQEAVVSIVEASLDPKPTPLDGSGIRTGNDTLATNLAAGSTIEADEAAAVFPASAVRGDAGRRVEVIILTSTHAGSAGDMFPHSFLGPDPDSRVHDLGHNVFARIVGDIDGRLWSGIKGNDGTGVDPLDPDLENPFGAPRSPVYMVGDSGLLIEDRHGTLVNPQTWTQPAALLRAWYDQTGWQDLGVTPPAVSYPLGVCTRPLPAFGDPSTWRDVWLEHAIVD